MLGTDSLYSGQSLLETGATLLQKEKGITKWATIAVNKAALCYYKVEQELLQSWTGLVLENGTTLLKNRLSIIKWENYYKVDQCKIKSESQP